MPLAIWVYMLVFAFASLWFSHYCLGALQALRAEPITARHSAIVVPAPQLDTHVAPDMGQALLLKDEK